ncbi:predicted protein [Sclerotinia sclerotiorum 1980 UF-70]|uniref:Uncharacterized protein n=1 Tax=Sclerotinia sclerotiorum (strain ATCC 18683 / 1980 / Ss-1) TaxID=665079 RepID=A7EAX8_SCLS1|nr:predicted protein [Sclerotinia sclerotiorum 1980 UF-70]EDN99606.1 predicted protein [Sclerotinia sclerotiorum 1980 UF-70]
MSNFSLSAWIMLQRDIFHNVRLRRVCRPEDAFTVKALGSIAFVEPLSDISNRNLYLQPRRKMLKGSIMHGYEEE